MNKTLHVYVDELGDVGPFDERSPIYLVGIVFLDGETDREKGLYAFRKAERAFGKGTFVHVGNLIRGEWPYEETLRERRQALFWSFFSYAAGIEFRFLTVKAEKKGIKNDEQLRKVLKDKLFDAVDANTAFFSDYDLLVVHYDGGQKLCTKMLHEVFLSRFERVMFENTRQFDDLFMQVADLICVLGNLHHKITYGCLSHSEEDFLGKRRMIKKEVLGRFKHKKLEFRS